MGIPVPQNLQLPQDAESTPFKLDGMFLVKDGYLMPTEIGGQKIAEESSEYEKSESEEGGEEAEEGGCGCGSEGESENCSECGKKKMGGANTFVLAIERALAKR